MSKVRNEYHLVSFDPGGTIGWAHFIYDLRAFSTPEAKVLRWLKHWECGEFEGTENEQVAECSRLIWRAKFGDMPYNTDTDVVAGALSRADFISEDFELTQMIGGKNLLSPVRINAKLDWECHRWGLTLNLQRRSMRTSVTPARLQMFGFDSPFRSNGAWSPTGRGKDAFAAVQHAIVWVRRVKEASRSKPWRAE
ncbi:MAG TPA: hypothetical protein VMP68_31385 [Candidatus Eisenbacteria bacterium]|nr:hypothetical protein [Candidatus Eisenbacteria bacterium]